uniref:Elongation of very long chain fatty acids protein n=1 Tax=Steinernema glaseri TaxID=37863 RepID=A0A1I7YH95_9BILA
MASSMVVGFDDEAAFRWFHAHRAHMLLLEAFYGYFLIYGPRLVRRHGLRCSEESLRTCNAVWNVINALGSGLLLLCLLPEFLYSLLFFGFQDSICEARSLYSGRLSGWAMSAFVLSKVWELGDTVWLILRRRPVLFLHSFHHSIVLFEVWISYRSAGSAGVVDAFIRLVFRRRRQMGSRHESRDPHGHVLLLRSASLRLENPPDVRLHHRLSDRPVHRRERGYSPGSTVYLERGQV